MYEIIEKAKQAKEMAYAPYSHFKVGACIEGDNGKLYSGCNIESVSFTPTICAERNAIGQAVMDGCKSFRKVAVACSGEGYAWPCGVCRQMLSEFGLDMMVIVVDKDGNTKSRTLRDLLPEAFTTYEEG
ncbi:MAG: cytidine deaminase [Clostridia bacterium]|nr:cytidine deaminase [Clostridia bacterium]